MCCYHFDVLIEYTLYHNTSSSPSLYSPSLNYIILYSLQSTCYFTKTTYNKFCTIKNHNNEFPIFITCEEQTHNKQNYRPSSN